MATSEAVISAELARASMLVGGVDVARRPEGWVATILLNPGVIRARADQQGLPDGSVRAAAASPRIQQQVAAVVEHVNDRLPGRDRIVSHRIDPMAGRSR
jgi:hypothetical protein